ncbi:MAG: DUF1361 domain-containing protein [Coleofasciculaceae cyanobacterium]
MMTILNEAWKALNIHSGWIVWNLFLAFIPLALSVWLFRRQSHSRSLLWWVCFIVFAAFLPNAPYLLTDIIHLIQATREGFSAWIITLVLIPQHLFAILTGFEAYVISLINLGYYLHRQGLSRFIIGAELITHALCSVGVYLGRFLRFNSWDLVTQPDDVIRSVVYDLIGKRPVVIMIVTFVVLTISYWLIKQVTLAILFRIRHKDSDNASQNF